MSDELVGKNVVVTLKDGYKKFGRLIEFEGAYITVEFRDGRKEVINFGMISKITEDNRG